MSNNYFVNGSPWKIVQVAGEIVPPFVDGADVTITEPSENTFILTVGTESFPNFTSNSSGHLIGNVGSTPLTLTAEPPNQISGSWEPMIGCGTAGGWVADEHGNGAPQADHGHDGRHGHRQPHREHAAASCS